MRVDGRARCACAEVSHHTKLIYFMFLFSDIVSSFLSAIRWPRPGASCCSLERSMWLERSPERRVFLLPPERLSAERSMIALPNQIPW